jgi:hypothetical protein
MRKEHRHRLLLCLLVAVTPLACNPAKPAGGGNEAVVKGVASTPMEDTYIFVYKEDQDLYGPAFATAGPTAADGAFTLNLPPGRYLFVSRRRSEGDTGGPVRSGDYRSKPVGPVEVRAGEPLVLNLLVEKKVGETKTLPVKEAVEGRTGISGRIVDADGKPVAKVRVHVYSYVQMSERPKYVSNETGPDGRYVIHLPEGGTYYLAARNRFGGPPKLGDLYGRYEDGTIDPSGVVVKNDEMLRDVDIIVHKVW